MSWATGFTFSLSHGAARTAARCSRIWRLTETAANGDPAEGCRARSSDSRGALEQAEFVVEVPGHRPQPGDGVAAAGEPERNRIVGAGAGDVQRLTVNRDRQRVEGVEAGAVPVQRRRGPGYVRDHHVRRAQQPVV